MRTIDSYIEQIDEVIAKGKFKDTWESLSAYQVPDWYKTQKFGLFVHWGCYSVPAVENEWFPRQMYQKGTKSWDWKIEHLGENGDYREIVERFNPQKFNADEWAQLFYDSGAKYVMPVCEHHDGVKMYESELNRWNMKKLLNRDFIAELHTAFDKKGLGLLCSSHRAEHLWFMGESLKNVPGSEAHNEEFRDLYGPCMEDDRVTPPEYWLRDWLASSCEMIDKNRPLGIYFDWWIFKREFRPYVKKFLAYYYNRCIEWGIEPVVFYKNGSMMTGCAVFDVERGQINSVARETWQCDTSIAKNSWGYTENNNFKTPYSCITNLIDVVSKNGCFMLNVGPKSDGTICDEEKNILLQIGKWLKINGEAIYGSEPYLVFGEGKKEENNAFLLDNLEYSLRDYRFTYRPGAIYIFPMHNKPRKSYTVKSLGLAHENVLRYEIKNIEVLGYDVKVKWTQDDAALRLSLSAPIESDMPICIKMSID